ncbi:MAG: O-antigen translocase [Ferruginibacter sp.]
MNIFKTSAYSAMSQATSLAVGLISVKVVASQIGPDGLALQGQFINFTSIMIIFATGAIGAGVIKYLAEYTGNAAMQLKVIRTAITTTFTCSLLAAIVTLVMSRWVAMHTLKDDSYTSVYWIYAIFLPLLSFNTLFSFILNGLKKIQILTFVNIFTSIVNLIFLILLANSYKIYGVLVAASFVSLLVFAVHIYFFSRYKWFPLRDLKPQWDKEFAVKLFKFSTMSILAGFGMPFAQMLIRDRLIEHISLTDAGYWQTVTRISDFYLSFLVSVLSIYLLPKLAELKKDEEIKHEIWQTAKYIFPLIIVMTLTIYMGKDLLIKYLLTEEFLPARSLFKYQLLGDVFKVGGWILSNILWAKAMTRKYLIVDGFFLVMYVVISYACINYYGLIGATIGFLITYIFYFIIMVAVNRKFVF